MPLKTVTVGDELPRRRFCPDEVQLFMYNAAIWNPHRIHYDHPYTTAVEGHPGIVIDGPLQGDYLTQLVLEWADGWAGLTGFQYTNRRASYLGETLVAGGRVVAVDDNGEVTLEIAVMNETGDVLTPGSARLRVFASGI